MAMRPAIKRVRHHEFRRRLAVDLVTNRFHYELNGSEFDDASLVHFEDIDLRVGYTLNKFYEIDEDDPLSAMETLEQRATLTRGDWRVTVKMSLTQTADAANFYIKGNLEAEEGAESFVSREFDVSVPRRLV